MTKPRNQTRPAPRGPTSAAKPTSSTPFLTLKPVEYSLTDGTDIPAPQQMTTPPQTPPDTDQHGRANGDHYAAANSNGATGGPLSSHPLTPVDVMSGDDASTFAFPPQPVPGPARMAASSPPNSAFENPSTTHRGSKLLPAVLAAQHVYSHSESTTSPSSPSLDRAGYRARARRPSFAQRFLNLRSISSLRSLRSGSSNRSVDRHGNPTNDSMTSLEASSSANGSHGFAHGAKPLPSPGRAQTWSGRNRTPSMLSTGSRFWGVGGDEEKDEGAAGGDARPTPRRKKSIDWLSNAARRSSGFFGRTPSMLPYPVDGGGMDDDGGAVESNAVESSEPPPTLPGVRRRWGELDGEDMFGGIGNEEH